MKTNFAALTNEELTVWSRDLWKAAREHSFVFKFAGKGPNSMIQRITDLTKSDKGARAVITLIADLEGDGVTGDHDLETNEERIKAYDQVVRLDQLRNANRLAGRLADQKSVVTFRGTSKDVLGYWLGDRIDQMAFLTLGGMDYTQRNTGGARPVLATGQNLGDLEFAADVSAPSSKRHLRWSAAGGGSLEVGDTTAVTADDTMSYRMLVRMKAYAKTQYIRGIKGKGNEEFYHVFVTPQGMASLKLDPDYMANVRNAGPRGDSNSLFSGSVVMQDGLVIHEFRHVPNTTTAAVGSKWGATGEVDGQRVIFAGSQAMGMADIGNPYWVEDSFDYGNQQGISVGKIFGLLKPQFHSNVTGDVQDFGVLVVDTAL